MPICLTETTTHCVNIQYPKSGALTEELADAIEQEFSDFEKALYSFDYNTHDYGYQNYIDVNSFVDYFIINEFTQNYDAGYLSTYLSKDIGGKYKMVIWDFNMRLQQLSGRYYRDRLPDQNTPWQKMLTRDEDYDRRIIQRYRMWRESFLQRGVSDGLYRPPSPPTWARPLTGILMSGAIRLRNISPWSRNPAIRTASRTR